MEKVKYSIIVPVYNVELYLGNCINSILEQTYTNFELILVDDGSSDRSGNISDQYANIDQRIKVIHKENGGVNAARKAGAKIATGNYVLCVDSDDWIDKNYVSSFNEILEKYHADVIVCNNYYANGDTFKEAISTEEEGFYTKKEMEEKIFPHLIESYNGSYFAPSIWGKCIRMDLYKNAQMQLVDHIGIGEDGAITIPCMMNAESLYINNTCLYYYRYNDNSITKNRPVYDLYYPLIIRDHLYKQIDVNNFDFKEQIDRKTVHDLFNAVRSQFNSDEPYKFIRFRILKCLENDSYQDSLKNALFKKYSKGWMACLLLRKKYIYMIKVLNRVIDR